MAEQPVLFAYDGSPLSRAAIERAGRELRSGRAAVVVTVWRPVETLPFLVPAIPLPTGMDDDLEKEANRVAEEGTELARAAGFDATLECVRTLDATWKAIVDTGEKRDAAVTVLGAHGHGRVREAVLGSVASSVVHHTRRPVFVVHRDE